MLKCFDSLLKQSGAGSGCFSRPFVPLDGSDRDFAVWRNWPFWLHLLVRHLQFSDVMLFGVLEFHHVLHWERLVNGGAGDSILYLF